MQIELRGFKFHKELSDDCEAFSGKLYVDGVFAAHIRNEGQGGEHRYDTVDKAAHAAFETEAKRLHPNRMESEDAFLDDLIEKWEDDKFVASSKKKGFFFVAKYWTGWYDIGGEKVPSGATITAYTRADQLDGLLAKEKAVKHEVIYSDEAGAADVAACKAKHEAWKERNLADCRLKDVAILKVWKANYEVVSKKKGNTKVGQTARALLALVNQVLDEKAVKAVA